MRLLGLSLMVVLVPPALASWRLQEFNRIGLTGKVNSQLVALGRGLPLSLPIISSTLVREDSILFGGDQQRVVAGRLAIDRDYSTIVQENYKTAPLSGTSIVTGSRVSSPSRLNSRLLRETAYAIYERPTGELYLLVVNVINGYLSAANRMENLLVEFDYMMTTSADVDEFIKQEALQRRGVYLAVAEVKDDRLIVHQVGADLADSFWSNVYLTIVSDGELKPLTEVVSSFAYDAAAGNNFLLMRRQVAELQEGDSLFVLTGVNDFESSEVMFYGPRALDKHVAGNVNKLSYYLGDSSSLGRIDRDDILRIDSGGQELRQGDSEKLLTQIDAVNYTMLYYLHRP